jgi:hypothetical protein
MFLSYTIAPEHEARFQGCKVSEFQGFKVELSPVNLETSQLCNLENRTAPFTNWYWWVTPPPPPY